MATFRFPSCSFFWYSLQFLLLIQTPVFCYIYQVGDLHGWGIPSSSNPHVYPTWFKNHNFRVGDSIFFLYPPSEDSVIQVTEESYKSCNLKDPILHMNNGNSLFNVSRPGEYYFTSGVEGHCEKSQKLYISVPGNGSAYAVSPASADGPSANAPSYPTVFGSIPVQASSSSRSSLVKVPIFMSAAAGILISLLI